MKVTWFGHSCFKLTHGDFSIVIDPYAYGFVPGLKPVDTQANRVLCTHDHDDHNHAAAVHCVAGPADPFTVTPIHTWHDEAQGTLRGDNTIFLLEAGGVRVAHLGDLGHLLTDEQVSQIGKLDALLLPVGGYFTIDAQQAYQVSTQLNPTVIVPMHYRAAHFGLTSIGTLEAFTQLCDPALLHDYQTDTLEIAQDMPHQVALLKCARGTY